MISQVKTAFTRPRWTFDYLKVQSRLFARIASKEGLIEAITYVPTVFWEATLHERYLRSRAEDHHLERNIFGNTMYVDLDDEGISQQLIQGGIHEKQATKVFAEELDTLARELETEPTIFEIGGNIGYYTLIEASVLDAPTIQVVEPEPTNIDLLQKNVRANGFQDLVDVTQGAISSTTGQTELHLSERSNCHTIEGRSGSTGGQTMQIETWTGDEFLAEHDIDPADVNVVRMDVEGHEAKIFQGIDAILESPGPTLVFVELHQELLDDGELEGVISKLESNGFEMRYACVDHFIHGPIDEFFSYDDLRTALTENPNVEVFAKKR